MTGLLTIVGPNGWLIAVESPPRNRRHTDWADPHGMPRPHVDNIRPTPPAIYDWQAEA